jgi:hypothetical protein
LRGRVSGTEASDCEIGDLNGFSIPMLAVYDSLRLNADVHARLVELAGPPPPADDQRTSPIPDQVKLRGRFNAQPSLYEEIGCRYRASHLTVASKIIGAAVDLCCQSLSSDVADGADIARSIQPRLQKVLKEILLSCLCGKDAKSSPVINMEDGDTGDGADEDATDVEADRIRGKFGAKALSDWSTIRSVLVESLGYVVFLFIFFFKKHDLFKEFPFTNEFIFMLNFIAGPHQHHRVVLMYINQRQTGK